MSETLTLIKEEVARHIVLWGDQNHPDGTGLPGDARRAANFKALMKVLASSDQMTWRDILYEEMLEVCDATDSEELKTELIQVAAVAVSWVEAIDRRQTNVRNTKEHQTGSSSTG